MKNSFNIVIRIKSEQLKCLKEKLQTAKLEAAFWEHQEKELIKKKAYCESQIRMKRKSGHLQYAHLGDSYLAFLKSEVLRLQEKRSQSELSLQGYYQQVHKILLDKKKFEKLQNRWR